MSEAKPLAQPDIFSRTPHIVGQINGCITHLCYHGARLERARNARDLQMMDAAAKDLQRLLTQGSSMVGTLSRVIKGGK